MLRTHTSNLVHSILTFGWLAASPVEVHGGWATGKSELAVALAVDHLEQYGGRPWVVGDSIESARYLAEAVAARTPAASQMIKVMTAEEYAEAGPGDDLGPRDAAVPTMVIYDDADRYEPIPQLASRTVNVWLSNIGAPARLEGFAARYTLPLSRTPEIALGTMHRLGLPGLAEGGTPRDMVLRSTSGQSTNQLVRALNAWGVVCVPSRSGRLTADHRTVTIESAQEVLAALSAAVLVDPSKSRAESSPQVSLTLSDQRSGELGTVAAAESALPVVPCLLEDLAAARPDIVVIASLDQDVEHLARLISTAKYGAVVLTSWGSPIHRLLEPVTPGWRLDR